MRSVGGTQQGFQHPGQKPPEPPYKLLLDDTPSQLLWLTRCQIFQLMGEKCEAETEGHLAIKFPYQMNIKYCFFDGRENSELFCQTMLNCIIGAYDVSIQSIPFSVPTSGFVPKQGVPHWFIIRFPIILSKLKNKWNLESWDNLFSAYISTPFIPPFSDSDVSTQILAKWLQGLFLSRRLSLPALGTLVPQENPFGKLWPWKNL